jgi:aspartate-semialdehyde dehydrogenase
MKKLAVAGATGAVGEEVLAVLEQRNFPLESIRLFASERSVGTKVKFGNAEHEIENLANTDFRGIDVIIFDTPDDVARRFVPIARDAGCIVIDNSSAFRMDPDVPLVIPEINPDEIKKHRGIIANPNCTSAIALMALWPLHKEFGVTRVSGTTYQAVSGAGVAGTQQLERETREYVQKWGMSIIPAPVFPYRILFNVIPQVGEFSANGDTDEEKKLQREGRKIMGHPRFQVSLTCARVPVMRAHTIDMLAFFKKPVSVQRARDVLRSASGVELKDDPERGKYPMPLSAAGKYNCEVGRIRKPSAFRNALRVLVSGDQLLKGAALNAVQIAELLLK